MKNITSLVVSITTIVALIWACNTKEINLITNVELDFQQSSTTDGFVNEFLPSSFTITPEKFLPEFEYSFEYSVLEGAGSFINANDEVLPENEQLLLTKAENASNFLLDLRYQPTVSGTHRVQVTARDNFEKELTAVLTYSIKDLDIIWEVTTPITITSPGVEVPISVFLKNNSDDPSLSFEWKYQYISGTGALVTMEDTPITPNQFRTIDPGTIALKAIPNEEGTTTIVFEVRDSNGQVVTRALSFDVSIDALDTNTAISSFNIDTNQGVITDTAIAIIVPDGTDLSNLIPTIVIPENAAIVPASGAAQNFTSSVSYTVTAQDGVTKATYLVTVTTENSTSAAAEILSFSIVGQAGILDPAAGTIAVTVPEGTDLSNVIPQITVSENASYSPEGAQDFGTNTTDFTVTAEDGSTRIWTVTVTKSTVPLTAITVAPTTLQADLATTTTSQLTVTFDPPNASNTALTWTSADTALATVSETGLVTLLETGEVEITARSDENTQLVATSKITISSSPTAIKINDSPTTLTINETLKVTAVITPANTTNPTVNWSSSDTTIATIDQTGTLTAVAEGLVTITAATDGDTFTDRIDITVNAAVNTSAEIMAFSINNVDGVIGDDTITVLLPATADLQNLNPIVVTSTNAEVSPKSGVSQDFSGSEPIPYVVIAEDGSTTKMYTVKVTKAVILSDEADMLSFEIDGTIGTIGTDNVTIEVPFGSDLSSLTPTITTSTNATVDPPSGQVNNFEGIITNTYTVTAQDGIAKKIYEINITEASSNLAEIKTFSINNVNGVINGTDIAITLPAGAKRTALRPTIILSDGATSVPASQDVVDFTNPVKFTTTADNGTSKRTYTVTVTIPNSNPTAVINATPISGFAPLDVTFDGSGSSDPDGNALNYTWKFLDNNSGFFTENTMRTYTTPGQYTVELTVDDGQGGFDKATVAITVEANTPPTIRDTRRTVLSGDLNTVKIVGAQANDADGDDLIITQITKSPSNGTARISNNKKDIEYTSTANYSGTDSITYTVSDGKGGTATGEIEFEVKQTSFDKLTGLYKAPAGATIFASSIAEPGDQFSISVEWYRDSNFSDRIGSQGIFVDTITSESEFTLRMPASSNEMYIRVYVSSGTIENYFVLSFNLDSKNGELATITSGQEEGDLPIPRNL